MGQPADCVICKLLAGELEVSMVHQDDLCSAFMDIQPVNRGHVLVVPNRHTAEVPGLTEAESARVLVLGPTDQCRASQERTEMRRGELLSGGW